MQTYQSFGNMDAQLEQTTSQLPISQSTAERPSPTAINTSTSESYSYPRTFHAPLAMNSPLDTGKFALWPPTPRYPEIKPEQGDNYSYSGPEESVTNGLTAESWDGGALDMNSEQLQPNGVHTQLQYRTPQENGWGRSRSEYESSLMGGLSAAEDGLSSSYGSAHSMPALGTEFPFPSTQSPMQGATLSLNTNIPRRISDATSLSSIDAIHSSASTDVTYSSYDDTPSLDGHYVPDYTHRSNLSWSSATTPLSPMMSPAQMSVRSGSRGRGSPSPGRRYPSRVAPYDPSKRWSTGNSTNYNTAALDPQLQRPQFYSHQSSPVCGAGQGYHSNNTSGRSSLYLGQHCVDRPDAPQLLPSAFHIPSHNLIDVPNHHSSEFTEPPNLYESLEKEQIPPPAEDMNPEDPTKKPHEQDLRFDGDLYTPRWVRGTGTDREGWCGICRPGRWLKLKNSAFWYDKSFSHGISAPSGLPFHEPKDIRRMVGNPDVWEGLCHSCNDWVALASTRKRATTWFRHAYKCHTHDKVKDAPKRRRESHSKPDTTTDYP